LLHCRGADSAVIYLNGSRLVRQNAQPIVNCVTANFHKNIDFVPPNRINNRFIIKAANIPVVVELLFESFKSTQNGPKNKAIFDGSADRARTCDILVTLIQMFP